MESTHEKQSSSFPHLERVHTPPSTPTLKSENDSNTQSEVEQEPYLEPFQGRFPTPSLTPAPSLNRLKKFRKEKPPSWRHVSEMFKPTLMLENSGSVARDHLASERTFLAYVRTSLLVASTGVVLVQLFAISAASSPATVANSPTLMQIQRFARPLGATLIVFGLIVLYHGVYRYFVIQTLLTKGMFPASRLPVVGITAVLAIITLVIFGILVAARH